MPRPRSLRPLEPIGTRLITSTPPARAESTAPLPTSAVARLVACCDEPHWVSIVVLATVRGRPALSHAVRPMLNACSPTWLTHPVTTWPTAAGSMPERSMAAFCTVASRSAGWTVESPPLRFPTGVRTASTITTSDMPATYPGAEPEARRRMCAVAAVQRHLALVPPWHDPADASATAATGGFEDEEQRGGADEGDEHRPEVELVEGADLVA